MIRASLGPYQLVRRLGRGGMAEVFLAIAHGASGFQREVAIKTLAPEHAGDPALERALIREATLGAGLRHRNLVAIHQLGVDDGAYYVVMQYLDRGDLRDRVLPLPLAIHVARELAHGLAYLHAATDARGLPLGLVHRDLSPANVLVSASGDVVLGDFGIAKATAHADLTGAGARKGTYAYMSPEQLAGEPVTPASDQFSLGATLVELATGASPFAGDTPWAIMEAIRAGAPIALPDELAAVCARLLAHDARDRYASMAEVAAALVTPAGPVELARFLSA